MHHPNPRALLRESYQALRLSAELLINDTNSPHDIHEILELIIRTADRSAAAAEQLVESDDEPGGV